MQSLSNEHILSDPNSVSRGLFEKFRTMPHAACRTLMIASLAALWTLPCSAAPLLSGFRPHAAFDEQVRDAWLEGNVRVRMLAPRDFQPERPSQLIVFATPNGNTLEQTCGSRLAPAHNGQPATDWRFDIQHVAAQSRLWRVRAPDCNVVLAVIEAETLSWPAWRAGRDDAPAASRRILDTLCDWLAGEVRITLACHSGGGAFLWSVIDSGDELPDDVERLSFLDANYSFDDSRGHGDKLVRWLRGDAGRMLHVLAYDDREIELDGKKVVGPTGGTFRATQRMIDILGAGLDWAPIEQDVWRLTTALAGRVQFAVHQNPGNRILHTRLVGEMHGLLHALAMQPDNKVAPPTADTGVRTWIEPAARIPDRPANAPGASTLVDALATATLAERERALTAEFLQGNLPTFLHSWRSVEYTASDAAGKSHTVRLQVLPDVLAIGDEDDWMRCPLTPQSAQLLADAFGASLPTRKVVDEIARAADVRLAPIPLTEAREGLATFLEHQQRIEATAPPERDRSLLTVGAKKDVVLTNRLGERPRRLGLYGWHQLNGEPIQPLTIVHFDGYVDYSHGVRLIQRTVLVNGKPWDFVRLAHHPQLHPLVSDEGPLTHRY